MPRRPPRSRPLATAVRWPAGIALTSWQYMWRTTPMHRVEVAGSAADDAPPPLPHGVPYDEIQLPEHGSGPLFHRRYRVRIRDSLARTEELMAFVSGAPDRVAPTEFASFQKVRGEEGRMALGDEFVVRMPGPWDGPVRVVDLQPTSFRLATLDGHLEAGQIEFTAAPEGERLVFHIRRGGAGGSRSPDV